MFLNNLLTQINQLILSKNKSTLVYHLLEKKKPSIMAGSATGSLLTLIFRKAAKLKHWGITST
jgi:hypothetical protein